MSLRKPAGNPSPNVEMGCWIQMANKWDIGDIQLIAMRRAFRRVPISENGPMDGNEEITIPNILASKSAKGRNDNRSLQLRAMEQEASRPVNELKTIGDKNRVTKTMGLKKTLSSPKKKEHSSTRGIMSMSAMIPIST